jgi:hypothetical protein
MFRQVVENIKHTHFIFNKCFSENRTVYEITSKIVVVTEKSQMTLLYGACALRAGLVRLYARTRPRARVPTRTHARTRKHAQTDQYVIQLIAFPQQQWFCERTSVLRYTCIVLVITVFFLATYSIIMSIF